MILFIDTHAELITIALKNKDKLYVKTKESEYSHSIFTMPMIEEIFKENKLDIKDFFYHRHSKNRMAIFTLFSFYI